MTELSIQIPGYEISEQIYHGLKTIVYRGMCDNMPVVLKLMSSEYPTFNEVIQFRHQYTIAKNLDIPGIIKPYRLETYNNSQIIVMEDFGGVSLNHWEKPISLDSFLTFAIEITDILIQLHRHRVIHKDIKPANILVNSQTQELKLIDFSIASLLPRETQQLQNPNILEGTLAYISPEQTGRMNRGIDYRTDFYSLGITFYELLTGNLPFVSDDPLELIHSHIAKLPVCASVVNPDIPQVLGKIIHKLVAKNAEDRYQSALGLKYDLETCLYEYQNTGTIGDFELGLYDVCDRFLIPEKLYGRDQEVSTILAAFERVSVGNTEMVLVAGFSGVGKTAVVNEVHKPITKQRGYFIKGKYDQFQRNIPLSAFVQAFRSLITQLLGESDTQLQHWKTEIFQAVGENGQVLIEVIPELEQIIGKQPAVVQLSGGAAQNQFNLLFQKFVRIFSTVDHPLVIFLDDLQWADSASLKLLQILIQNAQYLLIIGAYRDHEVSPTHPFISTVNEISKTEALVTSITLKPLKSEHINQLIADTLSCTNTIAQPLTELVYQKTAGNPFFATQFLKSLYDDGWIWLELGAWQCNIAQIKELALTDDVVEFMALQLQKLPTSSQNILKLAACIGAQFDLNALSIVSQQSPEETASDLWKALQEGLVLPTTETYKFFTNTEKLNIFAIPEVDFNPTYKFLHDRIQQAAYSLIPEAQKQLTHLHIGELFLSNSVTREQKIFDIVNHLNLAISLIQQPDKKMELAQLNLSAASKAKAATAYTSAAKYLTSGIELLPADSWQSQYQLTLELYEAAAEIFYLCGDFEQSDKLSQIAIQQTSSILDQVKCYEITIQSYLAQTRLDEALTTSLSILKLLGLNLPHHPNKIQTLLYLGKTKLALLGKSPDTLINLPEMQDPRQLAIMRILTSSLSAAYIGRPKLLPLIVLSMVNVSVKYGNSYLSSFAYAWYGVILCGVLQDIKNGYQFGQLSLRLQEKFNNPATKTKNMFMVYTFIEHWCQPIQKDLNSLLEAYQHGTEWGDAEYSSWTAGTIVFHHFFSGAELSELAEKAKFYNAAVGNFKQGNARLYVQIYYQLILNLLGDFPEPHRLKGEIYDQDRQVPLQIAAKDASGLFFFYSAQILLCYLFGKYDEVIENTKLVQPYLPANSSLYAITQFYFYPSLAQLALYAGVSKSKQKEILQQVKIQQKQLKKWANHAPSNCLHKWYLVEAERYRVLDQKESAIACYDQATSLAKEHKFIHEEALSLELTAKFYLAWGKQKVAQSYMLDAYSAYTRWGTLAKIKDLEQSYPQLLAPILQQQSAILGETTQNQTQYTTSRTISGSISQQLDLATIVKAYQSLSSEIEQEKLLTNLLLVMLENAGADKSVLLLPKNDQWVIEAIYKLGKPPIFVESIPVDISDNLPVSVINKVKNTLKPIIIDDAEADEHLAIDSYVINQHPQSIICIPILNQVKLIGILYLENSLTTGVFTSDRVELLNILCAQAAIVLENAKLYQAAQQTETELRQQTQELQNALRTQQRMTATLESQREATFDGILIVDENRRVIFYNHLFIEIFQVPDEIIQTFDAHQLLEYVMAQAENPSDFQAKIEHLYQNPDLISHDEIALTQGRTLERRSMGVRSLDGKNYGRIWYFRDISDRKYLEEELRLKQFSIDRTSICVWWIQPDGKISYANDAACRDSGYSPHEITQLSIFDIDVNVPQHTWTQYWEKLKEKRSVSIESEHRHRNGSLYPVEITIHYMEVNDKEYNCAFIVNISDRKRTEALLRQQADELLEAFQELQQAQVQLVQSEKMSALGNLVAGVAHEINNPIGFLSGNIRPALEYIKDIFALLDLYQQKYPDADTEIQDQIAEIDLEFIRADLPKLVSSMHEGVRRIQAISTSLRTFSRADTDRPVACNLHDGIESTILILKHRLKANESRPEIQVISNYAKLPQIECFAGQLNQVFMNILANAIDALEDANIGRSFEDIDQNPNYITVTTTMTDDQKKVIISIKDNGKGMTEAVKSRIFDHLYTTKGVGRGTGLGLAIARQIIIEKHRGTIDVQTSPGIGTEFTIVIPIQAVQ
jgi:PAS domain S-box-containing protein